MDGRKHEEGEEVRKRRGPEIVLFWGKEEGGVGRRSNMEISSPFSRLNRVALNGHGGGR
jgi:hypothetical protein